MINGVLRSIVAFAKDDDGDWVADLACLHRQHVRHRPPFWDQAWVLTSSGRADHIGTDLDCPLCDRTELPDGLRLVRTAGPFDARSLPTGLRATHQVASGTWGCLRVVEGSVGFWMATDPPMELRLGAGQVQHIPPGVSHRLTVEESMLVAVDFLVRPNDDR